MHHERAPEHQSKLLHRGGLAGAGLPNEQHLRVPRMTKMESQSEGPRHESAHGSGTGSPIATHAPTRSIVTSAGRVRANRPAEMASPAAEVAISQGRSIRPMRTPDGDGAICGATGVHVSSRHTRVPRACLFRAHLRLM